MIEGDGKYFTTIVCHSDEGWLKQRRKGVGGSDVAGIMGISKWSTPAKVWMQKMGTVDDDISEVPYVKFGTFMEPYLGALYKTKHPDSEVRRVDAICQSIERPWAQASLDFEVLDPEIGEWGVLEIKTAKSNADWSDGIPAYYYTQVTHYMSVTGRKYADVFVFFRDSCETETYRVLRDEDDIAAVNEAVDEFWGFVESGTMPMLSGDDISDYAYMVGKPDAEIVESHDVDIDRLIDAYQNWSAAEREASAAKRDAAAKLMQAIGQHKGITTDVATVTWTRRNIRRFDTKRFKEDHPELFLAYSEERVESGGLRVKEL